MTDILDDYFDWRAEQEDRIGTHWRRLPYVATP
jgi:hypothetical protein